MAQSFGDVPEKWVIIRLSTFAPTPWAVYVAVGHGNGPLASYHATHVEAVQHMLRYDLRRTAPTPSVLELLCTSDIAAGIAAARKARENAIEHATEQARQLSALFDS